jgi:hypothetical protein
MKRTLQSDAVKRSLQASVLPIAVGVAANGVAARAAMRGREPDDGGLRHALRVTGNVAFTAFGLPLAVPGRLPPNSPRLFWRAFLGAHAVHAGLIARVARRSHKTPSFSSISIVGGALGYTTIVALSASAIAPGRPPDQRWRRHLQRSGHNVLLGIHAFTIAHGYFAKGRNAAAYGPLAALWLAAARGMARSWRA